MLLSCRILTDVSGVNSFEYANTMEMTEGDAQSLYVQLVDAALDRPDCGFVPSGRRYMPPVGSTLELTLGNIDDAKKVVRLAAQPFAQDPSIWTISVLSTDKIRGTVPINLKLVEPSRTLRGRLNNGLSVRSQSA